MSHPASHSPSGGPPSSSHGSRLGLLLLFVLLLVGILSNREFFLRVLERLEEVPLSALFLMILLETGNLFVTGLSFWSMEKRDWPVFTVKKGFQTSLYAAFFRVTTFGSGVDVARAYFLSRLGIPPGEGMGACFLQNAVNKLVLTLYGAVALLAWPPLRHSLGPYEKWVWAAILFSCLLTVLLWLLALCRPLARRAIALLDLVSRRWPRWKSLAEKGRELIERLQEKTHGMMQDKSLFVRLFLLSALSQLLWYLIPWASFAGQDVSPMGSIAITGAACMLAGVIPTPTGFGSMDILFPMLFTPMVGAVDAATVMVLYRFITTFLPFFAGTAYVFCLHGVGKKPGHENL